MSLKIPGLTTLVVGVLSVLLLGQGPESPPEFSIEKAWTHRTGVFNQGAARSVAFDPKTKRLLVANAAAGTVDVLDLATGEKLAAFDVSSWGDPRFVAVHDGLAAVAVSAPKRTKPGHVVFFPAAGGEAAGVVKVGAAPSMLVFTPDGARVLVANEGEPSDDYKDDPEGSISIIDLAGGPAAARVKRLDFRAFNRKKKDLCAAGVRIFGPGAKVAEDLEPEHIAVAADGSRAWVSLQENNALALVDLVKPKIAAVVPLGTKDHRLPANVLDACDQEDQIRLSRWPLNGLYQPNELAAFEVDGETRLLCANGGAARDYEGYREAVRVGKLKLDEEAFPGAFRLQGDKELGRLWASLATGDSDGDGDHDEIHAFGARSFSIRDAEGALLWDSGCDFERYTAERMPRAFNSANDVRSSWDGRSDDRGPEPGCLAVGSVEGVRMGFVGLVQMGGVMVYDLRDPRAPAFTAWRHERDFSGYPEKDTAGDLGPAGLVFIPAEDSSVRTDLLAVSNAVSGSVTLYRLMWLD